MKDDSISYLDTCAQRFKDTTTWEWHDSIRYVKSQPISQHTCHTKIYCVKQRSFFVLILQQHSNVCRRSQHGSTRLWNIRHQVLWKSCCKYARLLISIDCFFYFLNCIQILFQGQGHSIVLLSSSNSCWYRCVFWVIERWNAVSFSYFLHKTFMFSVRTEW